MASTDTPSAAPVNYDNDFWRFSLVVYGAEGVAAECLGLQDMLGIDVNVLLFCAWLGTRGAQLQRKDVEAAMRAVAVWQDDVVRPLRAIRQFTKTKCDDEAFRTSLKQIELRAEQIEQAKLFALSGQLAGAAPAADRRAAIVKNINECIAIAPGGAPVGAAAIAHLVDAALRVR